MKPNARISQEEIFGPVLAVTKARNFDDALKIANGTVYGLTGAVYTENPEKQQRAADEFFVGNLYINRKCTGALVGVNPFGGFNLSGTDSKAGGRDYLLLFCRPSRSPARSAAPGASRRRASPERAPAGRSPPPRAARGRNGRLSRKAMADSGWGASKIRAHVRRFG